MASPRLLRPLLRPAKRNPPAPQLLQSFRGNGPATSRRFDRLGHRSGSRRALVIRPCPVTRTGHGQVNLIPEEPPEEPIPTLVLANPAFGLIGPSHRVAKIVEAEGTGFTVAL